MHFESHEPHAPNRSAMPMSGSGSPMCISTLAFHGLHSAIFFFWTRRRALRCRSSVLGMYVRTEMRTSEEKGQKDRDRRLPAKSFPCIQTGQLFRRWEGDGWTVCAHGETRPVLCAARLVSTWPKAAASTSPARSTCRSGESTPSFTVCRPPATLTCSVPVLHSHCYLRQPAPTNNAHWS